MRFIFTVSFMLVFRESPPCQVVESFDFKAVVLGASFEPVEGAFVKNFRTEKFAVSDKSGLISLDCQANDSLLVNALGYELKIVRLSQHAGSHIQLKQMTYQLKQVNVYDMKGWEAFKKDFIELDVPGEKVNTNGLPKGKTSIKPPELRNSFSENPGPINFIVNPVSSFLYYFNEKEKAKRQVWSMMQADIREQVYWGIMKRDTILKLMPVPDSIVGDFIVYCNRHIEDKSLSNEYYYKEKIGQLYPFFLEERKNKK